jgi:hypothetical protein
MRSMSVEKTVETTVANPLPGVVIVPQRTEKFEWDRRSGRARRRLAQFLYGVARTSPSVRQIAIEGIARLTHPMQQGVHIARRDPDVKLARHPGRHLGAAQIFVPRQSFKKINVIGGPDGSGHQVRPLASVILLGYNH